MDKTDHRRGKEYQWPSTEDRLEEAKKRHMRSFWTMWGKWADLSHLPQEEREFATFHEDIAKMAHSQDISEENLYYSQLHAIYDCLYEAFWEYANMIPITKRFINSHLAPYLRLVKDFSWSDKKTNPDLYNETVNSTISAWNSIKGYIIDYAAEADDKMVADLMRAGKTKEEADSIITWRYNKFLRLLRQRVQYVPMTK